MVGCDLADQVREHGFQESRAVASEVLVIVIQRAPRIYGHAPPFTREIGNRIEFDHIR